MVVASCGVATAKAPGTVAPGRDAAVLAATVSWTGGGISVVAVSARMSTGTFGMAAMVASFVPAFMMTQPPPITVITSKDAITSIVPGTLLSEAGAGKCNSGISSF